MDAKRVIKIFRTNLILIVSVSLLGLAIGVAYSLLAVEKYAAKTQLYVSASALNGSASELAQGASYSTQIVRSYVDVATSNIVLDRVIDDLHLDLNPDELSQRVDVSSPQGSVLIEIKAWDPDPIRAADISNSLASNLKIVVEDELEMRGSDSQRLVRLTTTERALPPESPESPNPLLDALIGLILGVLTGVGLAFSRDLLDTRIRSLDDVSEVDDIPVLGGIVDDPNVRENPLTLRAKPDSPRAESFRALRTNLQFLNIGDSGRVYVITSANPGEGKSTTSANLALSLAEAGSSVALIEADLRLPKVHEYMGVEGSSGLTDLLVGRVELDDVLERWGRSSLYFLPAGKIPPNPSELLGSQEMKVLLDQLSRKFDYVIVDAPPILSVTDAAVIGQRAGGALVTVAAGKTRKNELANALFSLGQAGVNVQGAVVTHLKNSDASKYGYGAYGYGKYGKSEA